jgi:hypothetical protein
MASFVLAYVSDNDYWTYGFGTNLGDDWLNNKRPDILKWLKENTIPYEILFEYQYPMEINKPPIRVRIEFPDETQAMQFRLTWS